MSISEEKVIIQAISHEIRRDTLKLVDSYPQSFTDLLNNFSISTGKLNYHLNQVKGFIIKNEESKYEITSLGKKALHILDIINDDIPSSDQKLIKVAFVSQKEIGRSLVIQGINLFIGFLIVIMGMHVVIAYIALTESEFNYFVAIIFLLIFLVETTLLVWLIKVKKSLPAFLERFSRHIAEIE